MTDQALERTSRRALLGAGAAAAAAATVAALSNPVRVRAISGGNFVLGSDNDAGADTTTVTKTGSGDVLKGTTADSGGRGVAGYATNLSGGIGVLGSADGGYGVHGFTSTGVAIKGLASGTDGTGVYASATTGTGVAGLTDTGTGVDAGAADGYGLRATNDSTTKAAATVSNGATTGTALSVTGKVALNRSGRVFIARNTRSVQVTVPGGLTTASLPFANLLLSVSGTWIAAVVPSTTTGKITIILNKNATVRVPVAWFVLK